MTYILTATLGTTIAEVLLDAESDEDATMDAIGVIMDNAHAYPDDVWGKGAITLTDSEGRVIHTMEAK